MFLLLDGQYGETGVFASTPAVIGKDGIEDVLELQMTEDELALFKKSCAVIRELCKKSRNYVMYLKYNFKINLLLYNFLPIIS